VNFGLCAQGFRSRIHLPGSLQHSTKAVFQIQGGKYLGTGFSVDVIGGRQICRLTVLGLDSTGQLEWVKKYGDTTLLYLTNNFISRVFYNHKGYIYYAGCATDSTQKQIGVFSKISYSGDTLWQKIYRDADSLEDVIPQMVTASVDGGFLITGMFQNWGSNGTRCMLIKTDANGNELWRKKISKVDPNVQDGKSIIQDSLTKKIVIAGYQYNFGNNSVDNILVLDSVGNELQQATYVNGYPRDMIQTRKGDMLVGGASVSVQNSWLSYQSYAAKFNLNNPSPPIWTSIRNEKNCDNVYTVIKELGNSNLLFAQMRDSFMVNENSDVSFICTDSEGLMIWNKQYDYELQTVVMDLDLTKDKGWIAAMDASTEDPSLFFFVKYDSTGCDTTVAYCNLKSALEEYNGADFLIYPIPCDERLVIKNTTGDLAARLFDCNGSLISDFKFAANEQQRLIPTEGLSPGLYLLRLEGGGAHLEKKVIIKH
jgi:hypothetical protein